MTCSDGQGAAAIPDASVGDAVEADLHIGRQHRRADYVRRAQCAGPQRRGFDKAAALDLISVVSHVCHSRPETLSHQCVQLTRPAFIRSRLISTK